MHVIGHYLQLLNYFFLYLFLPKASFRIYTLDPAKKESILAINERRAEEMAGLQVLSGGKPFFYCPKGPMILGEAPIYRASDSTLHWVDCLADPCELYILKVDPETGDAIPDSLRVLKLEDSVTVQFFRKNHPGSYIAAYYQGVCFLDEETGKMEIVKEIIPTEKRDELRFNDGGIDAKGRFWLAEIDKVAMAYGPNQLPASYGRPKGKLWRYDPDGTLHEMLDGGVVCGNGLGWSPDNKTCSFTYPLIS
jgi:sugar lactone lactonase YvrE